METFYECDLTFLVKFPAFDTLEARHIRETIIKSIVERIPYVVSLTSKGDLIPKGNLGK